MRTVGVTQSMGEGRVEISLLVQVPARLDLEALYAAPREVEGVELIRVGHSM